MVDINKISYDWKAAAKRAESYVDTTQRGVIILADISGYTSLLTSTELTLASKIVTHIIDRIFRATTADFIVSEIEGDALFVYTVEPPTGEALFTTTLTQLEAYSDAFYHAMDELKWSNLRDVAELRNVLSSISLKFIVHYGTFGFHKLGPFVQLIGPDVILAHRLMKNAVESDSYFLFTKPFLELDEDMAHAKALAHVEEVKHFGTVDVGFRTFDYDTEHDERHGSDHDHLTRKDLLIE